MTMNVGTSGTVTIQAHRACSHHRRGYMAVNRGSTVTTLDVTCLDCQRIVRAEGRGTPGIELEERIMAEAIF